MAKSRKYTTLFNADSSGFKKGTSEVIKALDETNKALVKNQYQQKDCSRTISDAQKELRKIAEEQKKTGVETDEQKEKIKKLNDTIDSEKAKLAQLRTEQTALKGNISQLSRELTDNNDRWTTIKGTIANLASDGIEFLSRKLLQLGKNVIAVGEQFSASMSEVGAISGASAADMELLEKTAREYGSTTKFSASEAAQALKYMALAGWDAQQSVDSLGSVLDLAAAGNMDLAKASDIVTDYITAFGLSVKDSSHFVDIMAYAMSHSNTNVEQLGEAYKNCAAGAGSMGYSVEDVTAALMTMANAGIKGGEAGTALNAVMTRLATDTKGCATELKQYGIEIYDQNDQMKSMASILESLSEQWSTLTDKQQSNIGKMIAGQNQLNAFKTIMAGLSDKAKETGQSFSDYTAALEKCDGTSKGMAKTMSDNLSGDLKTMQSAFEELALKIYEDGETPLRNLVKTITNEGVPAIEKIIENLDKLIPIVIAAGTAFVSYKAALGMTAAVNSLVQTMKALDAATQGAAAAQGTLNAVQAANPAGLVAAALGLLIGGLTSYALIASNSAKETGNLNIETENYLSTLNQMKVKSEESLNVINNLKTTYDELRTSTNLTAEEETKLNSVAESLAETLGISIDALKEKDGTYKDITKDIDEYIKKLQEQIRFEGAKEGLTEAYKAYDQAKEKALEYYSAMEEQQKKVNKLTEEYNNAFKSDYETNSDREAALRGVKINLETEQKELEKLSGAWGDYYIQASTAAEYIQQYTIDLGGSAEKAAEEFEKNMDALNGAEPSLNGISENLKKSASAAVNAKNEFDNFSTSVENVGDKTATIEKFAKSIENLEATAQKLKSSLSDLSGAYEKLEKGQALDIETTLSLIEKYPEYSGMLLAAAGNIDLQRQAIEKLFQAKKEEYILNQQKAIDELEASNNVARTEIKNIYDRIQAMKELAQVMNKFLGIKISDKLISDNDKVRQRIEAFNQTIDENLKKIQLLKNNIALVQGATLANYKVSSSSVSSSASATTTTTSSSSDSKKNTEDVEKDKLDAYLKLIDQKKALDQVSLRSEIASYDYALKAYKATEEQKMDIAKRRYNAEKQLRQQNLNYAQAAYDKLINGKIKEYEDKSKAAQQTADKKIKELDDKLKQKQQQDDDDRRKKELADIDAELKYKKNYLTATEKNSLLKRRQDIINEQASINYGRSIELKKNQLQEQANSQISRNTTAIERLSAALDNAAYYFAKAADKQTAQQVINNSTNNQTINYLRQGTTEEEFRRLMKTVY